MTPLRSQAPEKRCTKCATVKLAADFPPSRTASDGRGGWCRTCANAATRDWRERNRERIAAANRARRVAPAPRPCSECGEDFTPNRADRIVCSDVCRWRRKRRLAREREAA